MVGPVLGLGMEAIARRLADASATMKVVATVGLVLVVQGFFSATFGTLARTFPAWLPQHTFDIGGVFIGADQMIITGIALAATVALFVFFRRTRLGLAMRGVVDNPELLDLGRTSPAAVRRWAWIIGSSFAELRGIEAGYGEHTVLRDVSLTVQPGTVVAVLGPNGPARRPCSASRLAFSDPRQGLSSWAARTSRGLGRSPAPGPGCATFPRAAASTRR